MNGIVWFEPMRRKFLGVFFVNRVVRVEPIRCGWDFLRIPLVMRVHREEKHGSALCLHVAMSLALKVGSRKLVVEVGGVCCLAGTDHTEKSPSKFERQLILLTQLHM